MNSIQAQSTHALPGPQDIVRVELNNGITVLVREKKRSRGQRNGRGGICRRRGADVGARTGPLEPAAPYQRAAIYLPLVLVTPAGDPAAARQHRAKPAQPLLWARDAEHS